MRIELRKVPRLKATAVHPVLLHRDRRHMSFERAFARVSRRIARRRPYDLAAEVADTSEGGIQLRFRGQRSRARTIFRADEWFWMKVSLGDVVAQTPTRFILGGDEYPYILLRTISRWHRSGGDRSLSAAGFVLDPGNDPELVALVADGFGERNSGREDSGRVVDSGHWLPFGPT